MRLWTLHPRYLDQQGLTALWREALLAQKVLAGLTRGYRHHPQLIRFRAMSNPSTAIAAYLHGVLTEALQRGYHFDARKITKKPTRKRLPETKGQLLYEWKHLNRKLAKRSRSLWLQNRRIKSPSPHPLFRLIPGTVRRWEKQGKNRPNTPIPF